MSKSAKYVVKVGFNVIAAGTVQQASELVKCLNEMTIADDRAGYTA